MKRRTGLQGRYQFQLRSVRNARVKGKRVLVRAELNVALDKAGRIVDDTRIRAVLPTLRLLRRRGARIIIATQIGRPNGRVVPSMSTKVLVNPLRRVLRVPVGFADDCVGARTERLIHAMRNGDVLLLENIRFHPGEERNDPAFAKRLGRIADVYVSECFGTAHRLHASVVRVPKLLPSYAGLRLIEEVRTLHRVLERPKRPLVVLLGGAKISTKIGLIRTLLTKVDELLLGGAIANAILQAHGLQIGTSLTEPNMRRAVRHLRITNVRMHLPVDVIVQGQKRIAARPVGKVGRRESIMDIGPETVRLYTAIMRTAGTVIWNGPMGKFEQKPFDAGTTAIARVLDRIYAFTVVGGGETVEALDRAHAAGHVDFISTGGGAMLEFLEGRTLPGIAALMGTNR